MPPELPGFYYDEAKRKYFRILDHHKAPPGAKYTKNAMKTEQAEAEKRRRDDEQAQWFRSWSPIQRHSASGSRRFGYALQRSLGRRPGACKAEVWRENTSYSAFKPSLHAHHVAQPGTIVGMQVHEPSHTLWCLCLNRSMYGLVIDPQVLCCIDSPVFQADYNASIPDFVPSTLSVTGANLAVVAGGEETVFFGYMDRYRNQWNNVPALYTRRRRPVLCYTSSCAHPTDTGLVLLGGQRELCFFRPEQHGQTVVLERINQEPSDILDVSWLGVNVALSGFRNGQIVLSDMRVTNRGLNHSVVRLWAPSSVHSLHKVTEHHVLAAGLQQNMHLYDLRYSKSLPSTAMKPSRPLITYTGYKNTAYADMPVAVHSGLNMIACSNADGAMQLFDLWSGREVKPSLAPDVRSANGERATALCFSSGGYRPESGPSLLAGKGGYVEQWSWGPAIEKR